MAADPAALLAEAEALADLDKIAAARQGVRHERKRVAEAEAQLQQAKDDLAAARDAERALQDSTRRGPLPTLAQIMEAQNRVRRAEDAAGFRKAVVRIREGVLAAAEELLEDAHAEAWAPVLDHGIRLRIAGGIACDEARRLTQGMGGDAIPPQVRADAEARKLAAYADAKPAWEAGLQIIRHAVSKGARLPDALVLYDAWPSSEGSERRQWGRPMRGVSNAA